MKKGRRKKKRKEKERQKENEGGTYMLATVASRTDPASRSAKPACIESTAMVPGNKGPPKNDKQMSSRVFVGFWVAGEIICFCPNNVATRMKCRSAASPDMSHALSSYSRLNELQDEASIS